MADDPHSRTAALVDGLRRQSLFRQLVPMEAGIGWPIPVRRTPGIYLRLPLFGMSRTDARTQLSPPFAMITLDFGTGRPVEYQDFGYTRPWPPAPVEPVGEFPHDAVRGLTTGDYLKARERLFECYDGLVASLRDGGPFTEATEFADLLGRLAEPSLLPYFRALGPKFYERFLGPGPVAT